MMRYRNTHVELLKENAELEAENERLRSQLPEGMQDCTIVFLECEKGHGRLTATNWIDRGCQTCENDRLKRQIEKRAKFTRFLLKMGRGSDALFINMYEQARRWQAKYFRLKAGDE